MTPRILIGVCCALALGVQSACTAEQDSPPNVLLVMADDLNSDMGAFGHPVVKTPNIDKLASRGVTFSRAYTQYPQCNQSRTSLLTSLYPEQTGVLSLKEHFRDENPNVVSLPQHFRENGYFTARVGKIFHQGVPTEIGSDGMDDPLAWDHMVNPRGVDRDVEDQIVSIVPPEEDKRKFGAILSWLSLAGAEMQHTDEIGANEAIKLLEENHPDKTGKPFFLALGFYRPHTPFVAPSEFFDIYPLEKIRSPDVPAGDRDNKPVAALADRKYQAQMTDTQKQQAIQAYYASISFIDAQLGKVMAALDRLGLSDNTLVVFVSDHGYQLGSHGLWQKRDLFENTARTPLIMVAPGVFERGKQTTVLAELVDIYPTLVSLAGLKSPAGDLQGQDLKAVLSGEADGRELAFSQSWSAAHLTRPEWKGREIMGYSIRTEHYRFTEWGGGEYGTELYDYRNDPTEFSNLAEMQGYEGVAAKMKLLLDEKLRAIDEGG